MAIIEETGFEIRDGGFVALGRISCTGADGNVFESHENIYLKKVKASWEKSNEDYIKGHDFFRETLYRAILRTEKESIYHMPSAALFWNIRRYLIQIIERLPNKTFSIRSEEETLSNIQKDFLPNSEYKLTNTMIDWKAGKIIHYPCLEDFIDEEYTVGPVDAQYQINKGKRKCFDFDPWALKDTENLDEWMAYDANRAFLQNLMGINNADILIGTLNRVRSVSRERLNKDFAALKANPMMFEEFKDFKNAEELAAACDPIIKFNKATVPNKSPVCIWHEDRALIIQGDLDLKTAGMVPIVGLPPFYL
ncbi:MAG: hypothetical protein KJ955_06425 [Nanoarchaeota archaeon]|nr:hypothetical protein [Nanoarchaeota archaeon]